MLTEPQKTAWGRDGFFILERLLDPAAGDAMLDETIELVRRVIPVERPDSHFHNLDGAMIHLEKKLNPAARVPEDHVSKVFSLHRRPRFRAFAQMPALLDALVDLMGRDLDCFQSQMIFKNPGAMGQPYHQDSFYFQFDHPQLGVWLAISAATLDNGCLVVLPGSHREPIHPHVVPERAGSNYGYLEITDHDFSGEVPVLMNPGDVLIFDANLMHRSYDNRASSRRAALVYHYTAAGTKILGQRYPVFDFTPACREGRPVAA
jgi:phytanoyl-CoA hydroxylase